MTKVKKLYHTEMGSSLLILTDELINEMINLNQNLNFTGYDLNENSSSSPLMYAIYNNKIDLFNKLLSSGVDINYTVVDFDWSSIHVALRSQNGFFLEQLLKTKKLDHYLKINDLNPIEHLFSNLNYSSYVDKKFIFNNLRKYIHHIEKISHLDHHKYFNMKESLFSENFEEVERYKFLLEVLPESWLRAHINIVGTKYAHNIIPVLNVLKDERESLNKVINLLEKNQIIEEGNTLLHYYVLSEIPHRAQFEMLDVNEEVIAALLDGGFDLSLKNNKGQNVEDRLLGTQLYKDYLTKQMYNRLQEEVESSSSINSIKKLKI